MCKRTFGFKMVFWEKWACKGTFELKLGFGEVGVQMDFWVNWGFRRNGHAKEHLG